MDKEWFDRALASAWSLVRTIAIECRRARESEEDLRTRLDSVCEMGARADAEIGTLKALIKEAMGDHVATNDCGIDPCMWCVDARAALGEEK